jgi:tetratricopeptide (TPR) repeat protein
MSATITTDERLESALKHKDLGNAAVAAGNWREASFQYKHCRLFLSTYYPPSGADDGTGGEVGAMLALTGRQQEAASLLDLEPALREAVADVIISTEANLALAHLKLERYDQARRSANVAVALKPDHAKALFRRGCAALALRDGDAARSDFQRVLALQPDDAAVVAKLAECDTLAQREREKLGQMCKRMFA